MVFGARLQFADHCFDLGPGRIALSIAGFVAEDKPIGRHPFLRLRLSLPAERPWRNDRPLWGIGTAEAHPHPQRHAGGPIERLRAGAEGRSARLRESRHGRQLSGRMVPRSKHATC